MYVGNELELYIYILNIPTEYSGLKGEKDALCLLLVQLSG